MSAGSKSGAARSEINVTPLVDIVLVLLIIFLVTMPIMMKQVTLEVPRKADISEDVSLASKQIIVTYRADQQVVLSDGLDAGKDRTIPASGLVAELRPMIEQKQGEKIVFVDFCDGVPWGDVVGTMDHIRSLDPSKGHNGITVALKKKEKKSDLQADPTRTDPCR